MSTNFKQHHKGYKSLITLIIFNLLILKILTMKILFTIKNLWKKSKPLSICFILVSLCSISQLTAQRFIELTNNGNGLMHINLGPNNSNTVMGRAAGINLDPSTATNNLLMGSSAGAILTTGSQNTFLGTQTGALVTTSIGNVYVGAQTGQNNPGEGNTFLGATAGRSSTGDRNVFVGFGAGATETGSNQLYISNTQRADALIRGDFMLEEVTINGDLNVADILQLRPTNADPGCTTNSDLGKLWMTGVGNGTVLRVCRGAANGWQDLF